MKKLKNFLDAKYGLSILSILLLALVTICVFLGLKGFYYVYIFSLGFLLGTFILGKTGFNSILILILTAFFWGTSFLILLSGILAVLSVPIREWVLLLPFLFIIPISIKLPVKSPLFKLKQSREEILLVIFAIISLIVHLVSVKDSIAPMLHDPISHATWAKQIVDTGLIEYFYSPGLHILVAFGEMADSIYVSKYLLIITNIFNALTFIPVYLFIKSYFKVKNFALITALLFLVAKYPSAFFWTMGKNALVVGIALMFLLLFVATLKLKKLPKIIALNSLVFVMFLTHYPIAIIGMIGLFFVTLSQGKFKDYFYNFGGLFLGIAWGFAKMHYKYTSSIESLVSSSTGRTLNFESMLSLGKEIYATQVNPIFNFPLGTYILVLGLLGLSIMLIVSIKTKRYRYFMFFFLSNILLAYLIEFLGPKFLHIVYSTQTLTLFIFIYFGVGFLFGEVVYPYIIKKIPRIGILLFSIVILLYLFGSYQIYTTYEEKQKKHDMVKSQDVEMFDWMEENLDGNPVVLNNAVRWGGMRAHIVYSGDGGAWIPAFTKFNVAMPFTEFSKEETHLKYDLYMRLRRGEYSCEDIEDLHKRGVSYYYKSEVEMFSKQFVPDEEDRNFELIHSIDDAKLYKIISCYQ